MTQTLKRRLQPFEQADQGQIIEALTAYLQDRDAGVTLVPRDEGIKADQLAPDFRVSASVRADCVSRARRELFSKRRPPRSQETHDEVARVAAAETDAEEVAMTTQCAREILASKRLKPPARRAIAGHIRAPSFREGAAPGPSGIRNSYIRYLSQMPGGLDALCGFVAIECQGG